jgi:hypothetical protein
VQAERITKFSWFPLAGLVGLADSGEVQLRWLSRRLPTERSMWLEVDGRSVVLDFEDGLLCRRPGGQRWPTWCGSVATPTADGRSG